MPSGIDKEYPLHYCAFYGLPEFEEVLKKVDANEINKSDPYGNLDLLSQIFLGNTPLHIAAMLCNTSNIVICNILCLRNLYASAKQQLCIRRSKYFWLATY